MGLDFSICVLEQHKHWQSYYFEHLHVPSNVISFRSHDLWYRVYIPLCTERNQGSEGLQNMLGPPRVRSWPGPLSHSLTWFRWLNCMLRITIVHINYPSLGTSQREWEGRSHRMVLTEWKMRKWMKNHTFHKWKFQLKLWRGSCQGEL